MRWTRGSYEPIGNSRWDDWPLTYVNVSGYERRRPSRALVHTKAGNAGAFTQLLQRYPALQAHLRRELSAQRVQLKGVGQAVRLFNLKPALQRFQQACREQGKRLANPPCAGNSGCVIQRRLIQR